MPAPNRYYSSTAQRAQLAGAISPSATSMTLDTVSGFPASVPFTLVLDPDLVTEEVVTVTAVGGLTLTIVRGEDGTTATPHDVGAVIKHALTARDLREPQEHMAANSGVHGVSGNLVGDSDNQALTNKQLDGTLNAFSNLPKGAIPGDTVYRDTAQTLTGKTIDGAANTVTNIAAATAISGRLPKTSLPTDTAYATDTTPGSFLATASGWSDGSSFLRLRNGVAYLRLNYTRTGAAITSSTNSGAVADNLICTLNSGNRPALEMEAACRYGGTTGGWCRFLANGEVYFIHGAPGVDLGNGDTLTVNLVYPI